MEKIGIITFHESDNYGTVLQAYALQTLIEENGYEAEIINYSRSNINNNNNNRKNSFIDRIFSVVKAYGIINLSKRATIKKSQNLVKKKFCDFRNERLHYSKQKINSYDEIKNIEKEYDAFVVGSDMVWNMDRANNLNIYFLKFTDYHKRIAYSPSFGSASIDVSKREEYKEGLMGFAHLSCRENSGVELINELTGKESILTGDPTITCEKRSWDDFKRNIDIPSRYILVYMFEGIPKWMKKNIIKIANLYEAEIIEIPLEVKGWCRNIRKHSKIIVGPEEFVDLFKSALCVITNSYHGLMFSIIFSKPFWVAQRSNQRWGQFEDRLTDMLKRLDCEKRLITPETELDELMIRDEKNVDLNKITELKEKSIQYISAALKSVKK